MSQAQFDADGLDATTFAPIELVDQRDQPWADVRLRFADWEWLNERYGPDGVDGYYLNGYGVQGLAMACRHRAGLEVHADGIDYNSEGDTCFIHFGSLEDAEQTAALLRAALGDPAELKAAIAIAREQGFED